MTVDVYVAAVFRHHRALDHALREVEKLESLFS